MPREGYGVELSQNVSTQDVAIPLYPGARMRPRGKGQGQEGSVRIGGWAGAEGFRVVVLDTRTDDEPARVLQFYREALAPFGVVLECSGRAPVDGAAEPDRQDREALRCDDGPGSRGHVLKVGVRNDFRAVSIDRRDGATAVGLVRVRFSR